MAGEWKDVEISAKLVTNIDEVALRRSSAAVENAFMNEAGGHSRFPGLTQFVDLTGVAPTYLAEWNGDLMAVSNSRIYRVDKAGTAEDVTGVPLSGSSRPQFDKTPESLLMAAGGPILKFRGVTTELLAGAPESTHVGYIDGYVLAIEPYTGTFRFSELDDEEIWNDLDVFAANGKPDNLTGMLITPFREILMTGDDSVEQYQPLPSGANPFYRRYATGEGVPYPYTLLAEDQGVWAVNNRKELARMSGQSSRPASDDIGLTLEGVDDWTGAWTTSMSLMGQKFVLLQVPVATNPYGTKGLTFLYDYRQKKWYTLYGWSNGVPQRWPGWSYVNLWNRHFVGGNGKVLELVNTAHTNDGEIQRMLGRTAHIDAWGHVGVDNVRARVKRGTAAQGAAAPLFGLRCLKDNKRWTKWNWKSLGTSGDTQNIIEFGPIGDGYTFQFEWMITDNCPVELVRLQAQVSPAEA